MVKGEVEGQWKVTDTAYARSKKLRAESAALLLSARATCVRSRELLHGAQALVARLRSEPAGR